MYFCGDVGGTKTLLALYKKEEKNFSPVKKKSFISKNYEALEKIIEEFLSDIKSPIISACFGIAGPIVEGVVKTPNLPWIIEQKNLNTLLKIESVFLINDLLANAYGIKTLSSSDFFVINKGNKEEGGNQAIISAGTGLGEAGLIFTEKGLVPFASEGGHCSLAIKDKEEFEIFSFLEKKYKGHISIERILSGAGLENLYHYMVEIKKEKKLEEPVVASLISSKAISKENGACIKALEFFVQFYGAEAGDLALKFLATGGVFLGGGIAPKILEALKNESFMKAFSNKGRLKTLLERIPVSVILNQETALRGAAYFAQNNSF